MSCKKAVNLKNRRICIGNLNKRIKIQVRNIAANNTNSIGNNEVFTELVEVWAAIETTRGSQLFDGVEISNPFTHKVYIRYIDIDFTKWIVIDNDRYEIVDVENLEQKNEWLLLMCTLKGDKTKKANDI